MTRSKRLIPFLLVILFLSSCYYDNLEELHPVINAANCDTSGTVSYANEIVPILISSCGINNSCHDGSSSFPLNTYAGVNGQATASSGSCSGMLLLAIKHDPCLTADQFMPQGGGMLDSCNIRKIEAWVNRGSRNN